MRIDTPPYLVDLQSTRESRATSTTKSGAATPAVAAKGVDLVAISTRSRDLARFKQDLSALPDVRLDRVALAKQQLQQGTYRVDPQVLAQKMLEGTAKG